MQNPNDAARDHSSLALLLVGIVDGEHGEYFDEDMDGCVGCVLLHGGGPSSCYLAAKHVAVIIARDLTNEDWVAERDLEVVRHLDGLQFRVLHRDETGLSSVTRNHLLNTAHSSESYMGNITRVKQ